MSKVNIWLILAPVHYVLCFIGFLTALFISTSAFAQTTQNSWKDYKNTNNIHIKFKPVKQSSLIEVNACLLTEGTPHQALDFLTRPESISNWLDNVKQVEVVSFITPSRNIMMTSLNGIWPVKPRQAFVYSDIFVKNTGEIIITQSDAGTQYKADKGFIRVVLKRAAWQLTPSKPNQIKICYNVIADPQGKIPSWLANRVALGSMYKTLQNVQQQFKVVSK